MSFNIAVAGKGGTGKTSISAMVIRYLKKTQTGAILAVDADPNANLGDSLGLEIGQTMGGIIAEFNGEKLRIPAGLTKESYIMLRLNQAMVESNRIDMVTMGRGEGADCYCYPNTILRQFLDEVSTNYKWMVMDNEAGMEHLSRRTTQNVDELLMVSDHSVKGVRAVARIRDLVKELKLVVKRQSVVINMVDGGLNPRVAEELEKLGLQATAVVPRDAAVYNCDLEQKPLLDLPDDSPAVRAVNSLLADTLGIK